MPNEASEGSVDRFGLAKQRFFVRFRVHGLPMSQKGPKGIEKASKIRSSMRREARDLERIATSYVSGAKAGLS